MRRLGVLIFPCAALAGILVGTRPMLAVVVACVLVIATAAATRPAEALASYGLAAFALVPVRWLPVPSFLATFSLPMLVVVLWLLKVVADKRQSASGPVLPRSIWILGAWIALGVTRSPKPTTSLAWSLSFVILALLPPVLARFTPGAAKAAQRWWVLLGAALGLFATVETFVLHANPLLGSIYAHGHTPLFQHWSVYRATTTLGHPLMNAAFFVPAAVLAFGNWLSTRRRGSLVAALCSATGILATASRGGLLALVAGAAITLLLSLKTSSRSRSGMLLGSVVVAVVVGFAASSYVGQRSASQEGDRSAAYRYQSLSTGTQLAGTSTFLGAGPGRAAELKGHTSGPARDLALENSWLELMVALGVPGLFLVGHVLYRAFANARRIGSPGVAGAIVAYSLMVASFNALEGNRPGHVLLGVLLILAFSTPDRAAAAKETSIVSGDSVVVAQ